MTSAFGSSRLLSLSYWVCRLAAAMLVLSVGTRAIAQDGQGDLARAKWVTAFMKLREGMEAEKAGNSPLALRLYQESRRGFLEIRRRYPAWQPEVVAYRLAFAERRLQDMNASLAAVDEGLGREELARLVGTLKSQMTGLVDRAVQAEEKLELAAAREAAVPDAVKAALKHREELDTIRQLADRLDVRIGTLAAEKEALAEEVARLGVERQKLRTQLHDMTRQLETLEGAAKALQRETN